MKTVQPDRNIEDIPAVITDHPELANIYPTVKPETNKSEEIITARRKRVYNIFKIPVYFALAIVATAAFFRLTPLLVLPDPFSGVFISIGIGLIALGIVVWEMRSIALNLYHNGLTRPIYFGAYILAFLFPAVWVYMGSYFLTLEEWFMLLGLLVGLSAITSLALAFIQKVKKFRFALFVSVSIALTIFNVALLHLLT